MVTIIPTIDWTGYETLLNATQNAFFQQPITWRRYLGGMDAFGEDENPEISDITLKGLIDYNSGRTWPITQYSESGEMDVENLALWLNIKYLNDAGYLDSNHNFSFKPDKDRFIIKGIIYKCEGWTDLSQTQDKPLFIMVILKRVSEETGQVVVVDSGTVIVEASGIWPATLDDRVLISTTYSMNLLKIHIEKQLFATRLPLVAALGFQNLYVTLDGLKDETDVTNLQAISDAFPEGLGIDAYFDMKLGNTSQIDWLINRFSGFSPEGKRMLIAASQESGENPASSPSNMLGAEYTTLAATWLAYVGSRAELVEDCSLIYKLDLQYPGDFAQIIKLITGFDKGRTYWQFSPDRMTYGPDMLANKALIDTHLGTTMPNEFDLFFTTYTHLTQIVVWQFHPEDAGLIRYVSGTLLGDITIVRVAILTLKNTSRIGYFCWMQLDNLFIGHDIVKPEYYPLQRIAPAFKFEFQLPLNFPDDWTEVEGIGLLNGSGNDRGMLITNLSDTDRIMPVTDFPGLIGVFTVNRGYGTNWADLAVNEIGVTEQEVLIKARSSAMYTFQISD